MRVIRITFSLIFVVVQNVGQECNVVLSRWAMGILTRPIATAPRRRNSFQLKLTNAAASNAPIGSTRIEGNSLYKKLRQSRPQRITETRFRDSNTFER